MHPSRVVEKGCPKMPVDPRYRTLARILGRAYEQCAKGKGETRHGDAKTPWEAQEGAITIGRQFPGFCLGQAVKKCLESRRLPCDAAAEELLGAIVYIAAEIYIIDLVPKRVAAKQAERDAAADRRNWDDDAAEHRRIRAMTPLLAKPWEPKGGG